MGIIIKHNRIKPKYSGKNKSRITAEDKQYLSWLKLQDYSCALCGMRNGIEWHHVKECSSDRKNHKQLIPLCGESCHRNGQTLSAHGTPKRFREFFPTEKQRALADKIYNQYITTKAAQ